MRPRYKKYSMRDIRRYWMRSRRIERRLMLKHGMKWTNPSDLKARREP